MNTDAFALRHIGPRKSDLSEMLTTVGVDTIDQLIHETVPDNIKLTNKLSLDPAMSEQEFASHIQELASKNQVFKSYIGLGYHQSVIPAVIQRNILENPGWYTAYTPYQAEIAQGRLEALLNFQTMVIDLTGMEIANASLLDEATAAAEAMTLLFSVRSREQKKSNAVKFFVSEEVLPQTVSLLQTRAEPIGIQLHIGSHTDFDFSSDFFGAILQYPGKSGQVYDYTSFISQANEADIKVAVAADILSLVKLRAPGEMGADVVVGTTQRFGIPLGYGGPHAAYFATKEAYKRNIPGRIIGVTKDTDGSRALRMALQTREQHIKRGKATSNICTAQVLLAVMAGMYGVYHGPDGLKYIANKVHNLAATLADAIEKLGLYQTNTAYFDTIQVKIAGDKVSAFAKAEKVNFHYPDAETVVIALNEATSLDDINTIIAIFAKALNKSSESITEIQSSDVLNNAVSRDTDFMTNPVFNSHHSETALMRYIKKLERKDISLNHSMIALGSCTMKLNAASEMLPLSDARWGNIHPFVPVEQAQGYQEMLRKLEDQLTEITGFAGTSLQPNSGAQGEYAGLMIIRAYHQSRGDGHRNICLIPSSSTHGVYESAIKEITSLIHENGGQVYMDGANMNAQVALTNPGAIGADVCHLNLHKTFAIPHGGGGPGVGPICVAEQLVPFLPNNPVIETGGDRAISAISAAPWGSALACLISYGYITMLGENGLRLYTGERGRAAHEMIIDCRPFKAHGIEVTDIAKRLMDYGFHAPTVSFPVAGTIMVEPTESENKEELDRFCDALISIRKEIDQATTEDTNNVLKNAPHTLGMLTADSWDLPYSREKAAYPLSYIAENKFWPAVRRVDDAYGDRNLVCACEPIEAYMEV